MSHIVIKNLSVKYGDSQVLKDLQFEVDQGEFVAIVGKSGCGKTTLLYALAGFITFYGEVSIPRNLGVIFQRHSVFPWLTVSENIGFGLKDENKIEQMKIVQKHLKLTELEDKKDKYPDELSMGQVQRIALARSLAHNPEVLLMDEPFGALDEYTRDKMQQWLLNIWAKNKKTILFVTHDIEEAVFLADRILVLDLNKITKEFMVPFPRPRYDNLKLSPEFNQLKGEIIESLKDF